MQLTNFNTPKEPLPKSCGYNETIIDFIHKTTVYKINKIIKSINLIFSSTIKINNSNTQIYSILKHKSIAEIRYYKISKRNNPIKPYRYHVQTSSNL